MIRRRSRAAGILKPIGCHTFRAMGITAYLENGGTLSFEPAVHLRDPRPLAKSLFRDRKCSRCA
jgi:hypothetical protein